LLSEDDSLRSLFWLKKYQLCLLNAKGGFTLTEFKFEYVTSTSNANRVEKASEDHAYVAVVDGPAINLTPMGKFVMPPPMYDKQVSLPFVPQAVCLFGHFGVAYLDKLKALFAFDCEKVGQEKHKQYDLSTLLAEYPQTKVT